MTHTYRRKNYFIDKRFQTKFILLFCAVVILSSVFIIGILLFSLQGSNTVAIENTHVIVKNTSDFIFPIIFQTVMLVSIFSGLAVIILSLLTSHKISGPLYRLIKDVDEVADGNLSVDFRTRGNDQLQNLSKGLRKMRDSISDNHKSIKQKYDELKRYLDATGYSLSSKDKDDIKKILESLEGKINEFKI